MTAVSIIMPCYNRAYDLARVLASYDEQDTDEPFEIIAVDDASTDQTYAVLCSFHPRNYRLQAIRQERNTGPAGARNQGIKASQSPLVVFVGDDILPTKDFIRGHLEAHCRFPLAQVAILGKAEWGIDLPVNTLMNHIDGEGGQQFSYYHMREGREYDFRHLYTCNISMKKEILLAEEAWFDTSFPYAAFEDAELGYRLAKRGLRILYQPQILGYHYHYHTIWSFSTRQFLSGLSSRLFLKKHSDLKFHPSFRGHYRRFLSMLPFMKRISEERAEHLDTLACHLASYYEWQPNDLLSKLYVPLLDYFYYNGVFKGLFGNARYSEWIHGAHAWAYLLPAIKQYTSLVSAENIPLPPGMHERVL